MYFVPCCSFLWSFLRSDVIYGLSKLLTSTGRQLCRSGEEGAGVKREESCVRRRRSDKTGRTRDYQSIRRETMRGGRRRAESSGIWVPIQKLKRFAHTTYTDAHTQTHVLLSCSSDQIETVPLCSYGCDDAQPKLLETSGRLAPTMTLTSTGFSSIDVWWFLWWDLFFAFLFVPVSRFDLQWGEITNDECVYDEKYSKRFSSCWHSTKEE